jgi:hypothetical protein
MDEEGGRMEIGKLNRAGLVSVFSHPTIRLALLLVLSIPSVLTGFAEPPISSEWKLRMTESLRKRIEKGYNNPFAIEVASTTETTALPSATAETIVPLLSSLTSLLTQATTETISFSREIRPSIEWPKAFWDLRESDDWSWRKRFNWFQNENPGEAPSATTEVGGSPAIPYAPAPRPSEEDREP